MHYLYSKFNKQNTSAREGSSLSSFKFHLNSLLTFSRAAKQFDKTDVSIVFKCTPDTLLNLCINVIDAMPLPTVYMWTTEDVCKWLSECGYGQYENTFRVNLITGRNLLLLDASALSLINIKDFTHIKQITGQIRDLYGFEIIKSDRSLLTLYPAYLENLYKLYRLKTGTKYNEHRSDVWRQLQLIRQNECICSHWDAAEHYLGKYFKCKELVGLVKQAKH